MELIPIYTDWGLHINRVKNHSGRASCRLCKDKIDRDEKCIRVTRDEFVRTNKGDETMLSRDYHYHGRCLSQRLKGYDVCVYCGQLTNTPWSKHWHMTTQPKTKEGCRVCNGCRLKHTMSGPPAHERATWGYRKAFNLMKFYGVTWVHTDPRLLTYSGRSSGRAKCRLCQERILTKKKSVRFYHFKKFYSKKMLHAHLLNRTLEGGFMYLNIDASSYFHCECLQKAMQ